MYMQLLEQAKSYPKVKKSFETQQGRIPIDPAMFAATGRRFIAKEKKKN